MTYIYKIFFQFTLFFIIFALISNSYAIDGNQNTQNNIKSNEPIQPNADSKTAKTPTPESESPTPTPTPTPITEKPDTVINSNQQDNQKNADKESGARNNDYIKKSNNLSNKEKNKEEKEQALNDEKAIDALLDTNKNITPQSKKLSKLVPNKIQSVDLDELNFNKNFNSIL
jgi:type IV secretory pathway VirB10-like protein